MLLSVVIPCYRSEDTLDAVAAETLEALSGLAAASDAELVLVVDGSPDDTGAVADRIAAADRRVVVVHLPANGGQHPALLAGIGVARGELIVTMDDDGQHRAGDIAALIEPLQRDPDVDVVYAVPRPGAHGRARSFASTAVKRLLRLAGVRHAEWVGAFRAFRSTLRPALQPGGGLINLDGMLAAATGRITAVPVAAAPRRAGRSTYTTAGLMRHAGAMLTGYGAHRLPDGQTLRSAWLAIAGIAGLALVAWGPALLVPDARICDDWWPLPQLYPDMGLPWLTPPALVLDAIGPVAFKVVSFVATVITGWTVLRITRRGLGLAAAERWLLAALITVLPFAAGRVGIDVLWTYTVSLAVFALAWLVLVDGQRDALGRPSWGRVAASTLLFLASFTTGSLLVFFALPMGHALLLATARRRPLLPVILRFALRHLPLLIAPVAFWVLRPRLFPSFGIWADYNRFAPWYTPLPIWARVTLVVLAALAVALTAVLATAPRGGGFRHARMSAGLAVGISIAGAGAGVFLTRERDAAAAFLIAGLMVVAGTMIAGWALAGARAPERTRDPLRTAAAGLGAFGLGMLPYAVVGKLPAFADLHSRHQMLLPVGVAIVILAALRILRGRRTVLVAGAAVTAAATLLSAQLSLELVADARKQEQIIAGLAAEPATASAGTIVLDDRTVEWNLEGRTPPYYEVTAWVGLATGEPGRFGVALSRVPRLLEGRDDAAMRRFGIGYDPAAPVAVAVVTPRPGANWWTLVLGRPALEVAVTRSASGLGG